MEQQTKNKRIMLQIIGVAILVIGLVGITYAFFNYTRTGTANIIKTGRVSFNSEQGTAINLTNMFPIDVANGIPNDNTKVGTVTINITGDTTYGEGIEYLVSAVNVTNTVGSKNLPISIDVSVTNNTENDPVTNLGTSDDDYFENRGSTTSYYKILATDTIEDNSELLVGYIAPGATGVDGNIVIKAYIDASKVAISDTYPEGDVSHTEGEEPNQTTVTDYTNGTTSTWVGDRIVFTTNEWNSLQTNGVSFQVKVEANEGTWVERPGITINYVDETGSITTSSKKIPLDATTYGDLPNPINQNVMYLFDGWYTEENGGVEVQSNSLFENGVSPTTLYAHWIDMCPGCVYSSSPYYYDGVVQDRVNTYTSWNTVGGTPTIVNNNQIKTLDQVQNDSYFIGMVLNENTNEIDRAFLCEKLSSRNNQFICVEQYNGDSNIVQKNSRILTKILGDPIVTNQEKYVIDDASNGVWYNAVVIRNSAGGKVISIMYQNQNNGYTEELSACENGTLDFMADG